MKKSLFLLFFLAKVFTAYGFPYNPNVPQDVWETVSPYFLPDGHEAIETLNTIFATAKTRSVIKDKGSLKGAGFHIKKSNNKKKFLVCSHPQLPSHLVKIYTSKAKDIVAWEKFIERIEGATLIRIAIEDHALEEYCTVPKKWIYPIPQTLNDQADSKHFILVVEKMPILSKKKSKKRWKDDTWMTQNHVHALFQCIVASGLFDLWYFNIPFTHDRKLVFIDTEYTNKWPINASFVLRFLPQTQKAFWKECIEMTDDVY